LHSLGWCPSQSNHVVGFRCSRSQPRWRDLTQRVQRCHGRTSNNYCRGVHQCCDRAHHGLCAAGSTDYHLHERGGGPGVLKLRDGHLELRETSSFHHNFELRETDYGCNLHKRGGRPVLPVRAAADHLRVQHDRYQPRWQDQPCGVLQLRDGHHIELRETGGVRFNLLERRGCPVLPVRAAAGSVCTFHHCAAAGRLGVQRDRHQP